MPLLRIRARRFAAALLLAPGAAWGQGPSVAELGTCPTAAGEPVLDCRLAYRTHGRLNARRDNAVLIPTWYAGRSEGMRFLLGPEAWVDTTRYHAILVDALGNGASTSPSTSAAQPGRRFPRLGLGDMVAAQHRLVTEHLGIPRLHAVVGWSMGGMQALEWAMRHPESVDRVVSVAGSPRMGTSELYWIRSSLTLLDLAARSGLPRDSLALRLAELWHMVATTPAYENRLPRDSVDAALAAEAEEEWLGLDPEDNRLQLQALAAFDRLTGGGVPRPRVLLLYAPEDQVTTAESFRAFARRGGVEAVELPTPCGHLLPLCERRQVAAHVRRHLEGP